MEKLPRLTVVLLGTALTMSACTGTCGRGAPVSGGQRAKPAVATRAAPPSGPPNVLALVLDVQEGAVQVLSSTPTRGTIITPTRAELTSPAGARDRLMIEYSIQSDSTSQVLRTGTFWVSTSAIVESETRDESAGAISIPRHTVTVVIPLVAEPASISFDRVDVTAGTPFERWPRTRVGRSALQGVPR